MREYSTPCNAIFERVSGIAHAQARATCTSPKKAVFPPCDESAPVICFGDGKKNPPLTVAGGTYGGERGKARLWRIVLAARAAPRGD